jgi:hypothetical protein
MDDIYKHNLLSENSTRVLEILPVSSPGLHFTLSCKLRTISLLEPPPYYAVSYVWGNTETTGVILVDGVPFMVRINLWRFLLQMQSEGCIGPLWIDAICINQNNLAERSQQVAIMGKIYSTATEVQVWLGPAAGNEGIIQAMQKLRTTDWASLRMQLLAKEYKSRATREALFKSLVVEFFDPILSLCSIDYWSRLWIVQEYVLAQRLKIWCGSEAIDGEVLNSLRGLLINFHLLIDIIPVCTFDDSQHIIGGDIDTVIEENIYEICNSLAMVTISERSSWSLGIGQEHSRSTVCRLVWAYREFKCADPHDHIYAIQSLHGSGPLIAPDYSKSTSELYQEVSNMWRREYKVSDHNRRIWMVSTMEHLSHTLQLSEDDVVVKSMLKELDSLMSELRQQNRRGNDE